MLLLTRALPQTPCGAAAQGQLSVVRALVFSSNTMCPSPRPNISLDLSGCCPSSCCPSKPSPCPCREPGPSFMALQPGRRDGEWETNGNKAAPEADADHKDENCLCKGVPRLLPSPAQATLALTFSAPPVDPGVGQAIPPLSCPYFLSTAGKREGWRGRDY